MDLLGRKPRILQPLKTGFEHPKNALLDPDGDGVPNFLDCSDHNPNKQGALGEMTSQYLQERKGIVGKVAKGYAKYKAETPEREKARIESLKRRAQIEEEKTKIAKAQQARRVARPRDTINYAAMFGLGGGLQQPAPAAPVKRKAKKRRKKKK